MTNAILQPEPLNGLETGLHVYPNLISNLININAPNQGGIVGLPVIASFANPMQFICSAIQAGSRLGYQESAELCAQYLAPILDAIKFNFLPFGLNQLRTAMTLPKQIPYSDPAAAATGLQGHHRARDLVARHVVLARQPRAGLGRTRHAGCRCAAVHGQYAHAGVAFGVDGRAGHRGAAGTAAPARNCSDRRTRMTRTTPPPPWYPQPGPPPGPAPGVIPGDPGGSPALRTRSRPAGTGPAGPPGPPLPAEAGRSRVMSRLREEQKAAMIVRRFSRTRRTVALLLAAVVLTSCGSWRGIANVPLPGGPGTGPDKMTIYVQMPDTLALNVNSRVRVADVYVGSGGDRVEELGRDAHARPAARH